MLNQGAILSDRAFSSVAASSKEAGDSGFDLGRVGEFLRETREKKGLSLADASKALFLTKSTVGAIESGRWAMLPHPIYVKGYVKSYACYLDVSDRVEEHMGAEPAGEGHAVRKGIEQRKDRTSLRHGWTDAFHNMPLKSLALLCSSVVGLAFGATATPALQTSSTGLVDIVTAFQTAVMNIGKLVLP